MSVVDTTVFLDAVVPEGHRYVGYTDGTVSDKSNREILKCSAIDSSSGMVSRATHLSRDSKVHNIYFALASFKEAKIYDDKKGYMRSHRHQSNVDKLKSLWLDIDFKNYGSALDAAKDIRRFVDESSLPDPTFIVNSGGGIHLYWCFETPLTVAEWTPLAHGLAGIAKKLNLKADYGVTIDSARVLRLPGTLNKKYDAAPECRVTKMGAFANLEQMQELLYPHTSESAMPGVSVKDFLGAEVISLFGPATDDLMAGFSAGRKATVEAARKRCASLDEAITTGGASDPYPRWKNLLHLLAYMDDGEQYIHRISDQHPKYSAEEAEERYQESVTLKLANSHGPTSCAKFAEDRPACRSCQYFGSIKGPWNLGYSRESENYQPTYVGNGETFYTRQVEGPEGEVEIEKVVIARSEMSKFHLVLGIEGELELRFIVANSQWKKEVSLTPEVIADSKQLAVALMKGGCGVTDAMLRECKGRLMAWLDTLQKGKELGNINSAGWSSDKKTFVLGGRAIRQDDEFEIVRDHAHSATYTPTGTLEAWQDVANYLARDERPEFGFLLATSFAGPLMRFGKPNSCVISVTSRDSGVGKSTVLRTAQAAWGSPTQMVFMDDTANAISGAATQSSDLPLYWDEVRGQEKTDQLANTVFRLNQGRDKRRMMANTNLREAKAINVMLVCATNNPIADHINKRITTSDAGAMRLLEFHMERDGRAVDHQFNAREAKLDYNYGHAGPLYIRYLMKHVDKIEPLLEKVRDMLCERHDFTQEKRFWLNSLTKICAAAVLLRGSGLVDIDPGRVLQFAIDVADQQVVAMEQYKTDMSNVIVDMVSRSITHLLVTDTIPHKPGPARVNVRRVPDRGKGTLIQIDLERMELYVAFNVIRDYAMEYHNGNLSHIKALVEKEFHGIKARRALGGGTDYPSPQTTVYRMSVKDTVGEDMVAKWVSDASSGPKPAQTATP